MAADTNKTLRIMLLAPSLEVFDLERLSSDLSDLQIRVRHFKSPYTLLNFLTEDKNAKWRKVRLIISNFKALYIDHVPGQSLNGRLLVLEKLKRKHIETGERLVIGCSLMTSLQRKMQSAGCDMVCNDDCLAMTIKLAMQSFNCNESSLSA